MGQNGSIELISSSRYPRAILMAAQKTLQTENARSISFRKTQNQQLMLTIIRWNFLILVRWFSYAALWSQQSPERKPERRTHFYSELFFTQYIEKEN
jgi:hypothetical protein